MRQRAALRLEGLDVAPAFDEHDPARNQVRLGADLFLRGFDRARRCVGNEQMTSGGIRLFCQARKQVVDDAIEIACLTRGVDRDELMQRPSLITIINTNSPLRLDGPMSDGVIELATHGQAIVATPFTLAGAMSPATLAGALAQQNAEALFGIVLTQLVRPGAPVMYGAFTSNVDMRSGALVTINQLADMIAKIAGIQVNKKHVSGPQGVRGRNSDNNRLRQALMWEPEISLEEGLTSTYSWILAQIQKKAPFEVFEEKPGLAHPQLDSVR
jgi:hypothetical protein